jgi:hypothetical protein
MNMRFAAILLVAALPFPSMAEDKPDQRLFADANLRERPTLSVFMGKYDTLPEFPTEKFVGISFELQWTANGQPMPSNLAPFHPGCIYRSATQYSCEALTRWFMDRPRTADREGVKSLDPQAFYLPDMEFDTEYCFRFNPNKSSWTQWSCVRTPPAPGVPPAPARPQVTTVAASTGSGMIGGSQPFQVLVEWQPVSSERLVAGYTVEMESHGKFFGLVPDEYDQAPGLDTYEKLMRVPADSDPDAIYAFRVCAVNISGKACSLAARTPGRAWAEKSAAGGKAAELPVAGPGDQFNATAKRHTSLPVDAAPSPPPDLETLAGRGESIASQDVLAMQLRGLQGEGLRLRGFDIGMAAAEGHSAPGPGKQRVHDALGSVEQQGFDTAVSFSLQRNANAVHAKKGAQIAQADPSVERARKSDPDVFYWLGFDIATGIFGDPALGADGNTLTGPGSMRIRDSLGTGAKLGFDDAVAFHLARKY